MEVKSSKIVVFICFILFYMVNAQEKHAYLPNLIIHENEQVWLDDYQNVYVKSTNQLTKYSENGNLINQLMLNANYKINSLQNPMFICLFSEDLQHLRFLDQNMTDRQSPFSFQEDFGYVKAVYIEDYQYIWLLDQSKNRLVQYNLSQKKIIQSFNINFSLEDVKQFLVFKNKLYLLENKAIEIYSLEIKLLNRILISDVVKLDIYQNDVYLFKKDLIGKFADGIEYQNVFSVKDSEYLGRNFEKYFAIIKNKLYLYPIN